MLGDLLYQFTDVFFGFNLFRYITVRAALAAITALLFSLLIGPKIIRLLKSRQLGEEIRSDGPETHLAKAGTPTMGGTIVLLGIVLGVAHLRSLGARLRLGRRDVHQVGVRAGRRWQAMAAQLGAESGGEQQAFH